MTERDRDQKQEKKKKRQRSQDTALYSFFKYLTLHRGFSTLNHPSTQLSPHSSAYSVTSRQCIYPFTYLKIPLTPPPSYLIICRSLYPSLYFPFHLTPHLQSVFPSHCLHLPLSLFLSSFIHVVFSLPCREHSGPRKEMGGDKSEV